MSGTPKVLTKAGRKATILDRVKAIRSTILTVGRKQPKEKDQRKKLQMSMFEVGDMEDESKSPASNQPGEASPGREDAHGKQQYMLSSDKKTFRYLGTDSEKGDVPVSDGLTSQDAAARVGVYGPNKLPEKKNSK